MTIMLLGAKANESSTAPDLFLIVAKLQADKEGLRNLIEALKEKAPLLFVPGEQDDLAEAVALLRATQRVLVRGDEDTSDSYACAGCGAVDVPGLDDDGGHTPCKPDCAIDLFLARYP